MTEDASLTEIKLQHERDWIPKREKKQHKPRCPTCHKSMKRLYDRSGPHGKAGFKTFPAYGCRDCVTVKEEREDA